jgi:3-deoxy-D-manno-octulosonate 8-phosphate phosphatase (KDO 8-P phosphatase)
MNFKVFILDVDGVMTNGQSFYSKSGKLMKIFGPDDNDGLRLLNPYIEIRFVTGDRKGLPITTKRIKKDIQFDLDLVSTIKRIEWIKKYYNPKEVIYMGDGIFDHYVMKEVGYSIAPANSDKIAKAHANYVTERSGGDRAVAEACLHVMKKFFTAYDPDHLPSDQLDFGEWKV